MTNVVSIIDIIVASVLDGILAIVVVCLSITANEMFHKSVLVKNLEESRDFELIWSDKTEPLTQNIMTVAQLVYDNELFRSPTAIT
ncbi:hypothetical protein PsorP6_006707 [Peronosclerospora sorghi]|uniref:Uncharacterized protein n=1 Tax=Peronosclerospora sorghi TaxID=230839 RepID=A0ACC0W2K4_9STRA|nr:hypothetical protein PsorP6_006707 [Peronosclerospora sorghi]